MKAKDRQHIGRRRPGPWHGCGTDSCRIPIANRIAARHRRPPVSPPTRGHINQGGDQKGRVGHRVSPASTNRKSPCSGGGRIKGVRSRDQPQSYLAPPRFPCYAGHQNHRRCPMKESSGFGAPFRLSDRDRRQPPCWSTPGSRATRCSPEGQVGAGDHPAPPHCRADPWPWRPCRQMRRPSRANWACRSCASTNSAEGSGPAMTGSR